MTIDAVSEMTNNALYVIIKVSLPVLLVSLIVGLIISIFQPALRLRRAENKLRIWSTTSTSKKTCRSRITKRCGTRRNSNRCR